MHTQLIEPRAHFSKSARIQQQVTSHRQDGKGSRSRRRRQKGVVKTVGRVWPNRNSVGWIPCQISGITEKYSDSITNHCGCNCLERSSRRQVIDRKPLNLILNQETHAGWPKAASNPHQSKTSAWRVVLQLPLQTHIKIWLVPLKANTKLVGSISKYGWFLSKRIQNW